MQKAPTARVVRLEKLGWTRKLGHESSNRLESPKAQEKCRIVHHEVMGYGGTRFQNIHIYLTEIITDNSRNCCLNLSKYSES